MGKVVAKTVLFYQILGDKATKLDHSRMDYIINVLSADYSDSGLDYKGDLEAIGEILVDSGVVKDYLEGREVCIKLFETFRKHGLVEPKLAAQNRATSFGMFDGMDQFQDTVPEKQPGELQEGFSLTERDRAELERKKSKDGCQIEAQHLIRFAEIEAAKEWMPVVSVNHDNNVKGPATKDIHMENFSVSVGGREFIQDGSVTLSFGRHYGLIGRNGTGKTTFLGNMVMEQEVVGDDTSALQCVLNADVERFQLLNEEARLTALQGALYVSGSTIFVLKYKGGLILAGDGFSFLEKEIAEKVGIAAVEEDIDVNQSKEDLRNFIEVYKPSTDEIHHMLLCIDERKKRVVVEKDYLKVIQVGESGHISVAYCGSTSIFEELRYRLDYEIDINTTEKEYSVDALADFTQDFLNSPKDPLDFGFPKNFDMNSLRSSVVLVSYETSEDNRRVPKVVHVSKQRKAPMRQGSFICDGCGITFASRVLDRHWRPDIELCEGIPILKETFQASFLGKLTGGIVRKDARLGVLGRRGK